MTEKHVQVMKQEENGQSSIQDGVSGNSGMNMEKRKKIVFLPVTIF